MIEYKYHLFSNQNESLKDIKSKCDSIQEQLIVFGLNYSNKISGTLKNERLFILRDSICNRIDSVIFHYEILNKVNRPDLNFSGNHFGTHLAMEISRKQNYIFDSIIFNLISSFDYIASLINFTFQKNKDNWKSTWNKLENKARCNNDYKSLEISKFIVESNKKWVSKLNDYRAALIHYEGENLGYKQTVFPVIGQTKILVYAPTNFRNKFKKLIKTDIEEEININSLTLWSIKVSLLEIECLIKHLEKYIDINRKVKKGKEILRK